MWDRLRRELELELAELSDLLTTAAELPTADRSARPTRVEVMAAGAVLHSFYNGAENLLKRIHVATEGSPPTGERWHTNLLDRAAHDTAHRPRVLTDALIARLDAYLRFRHAFRHLYAQHLEWGRMVDLLRDLPSVVEALRAEVSDFLSRLEGWSTPARGSAPAR